jgi:hypothetical protein
LIFLRELTDVQMRLVILQRVQWRLWLVSSHWVTCYLFRMVVLAFREGGRQLRDQQMCRSLLRLWRSRTASHKRLQTLYYRVVSVLINWKPDAVVQWETLHFVSDVYIIFWASFSQNTMTYRVADFGTYLCANVFLFILTSLQDPRRVFCTFLIPNSHCNNVAVKRRIRASSKWHLPANRSFFLRQMRRLMQPNGSSIR